MIDGIKGIDEVPIQAIMRETKKMDDSRGVLLILFVARHDTSMEVGSTSNNLRWLHVFVYAKLILWDQYTCVFWGLLMNKLLVVEPNSLESQRREDHKPLKGYERLYAMKGR